MPRQVPLARRDVAGPMLDTAAGDGDAKKRQSWLGSPLRAQAFRYPVPGLAVLPGRRFGKRQCGGGDTQSPKAH